MVGEKYFYRYWHNYIKTHNFTTNFIDTTTIQNSDGRPEFVEKFKLECKKKYVDECKNYNRRINIYLGYIDKNYNDLSTHYQFLGGINNEEQQTILETNERYKN